MITFSTALIKFVVSSSVLLQAAHADVNCSTHVHENWLLGFHVLVMKVIGFQIIHKGILIYLISVL
jgi:hypothetical protein